MNYRDAALQARAFRLGRALRTASFRHRRLVDDPLVLVLWQLGAEPFSAGAVAFGSSPAPPALSVAGEPRNRDLAFAALLPMARWFNRRFEAHAARRGPAPPGGPPGLCALTAPQVLVANAATAEHLGRLGRRLAYLATDGPKPADPDLVRLGRHLLFLWYHWAVPGQQLLVSLTDLLNGHWATPQSAFERQSLAALDAYVDPPPGTHGFDAAARAERHTVGPVPSGEDDAQLDPLLDRFNAGRAGSTAASIVRPLLAPIEAHYHRLTAPTWELLWRCRTRELRYREAASVERRWGEDRRAYTAHMDWMARSGLRRTRQTARQAARTLRDLEEAGRLQEAEEACDDPFRMIPAILENKAIRGRVTAVDPEHRELAGSRRVRRPLVTLDSREVCLMPVGKELFWTEQSAGREFIVHSVCPSPAGGTRATLKLMTGSGKTTLPTVGDVACFSVHSTARSWLGELPATEPWTHRTAVPPAGATAFEEDEEAER